MAEPTMKQIAERQEIVFEELYTVEDILKGDIIAMHQEAWRVAREQLRKELKHD